METMNKNKLWSGRFILCICAAIALVVIALALALILWDTRKQPEINGAILAAMTMLSGVLSSIVTFYFTRHNQPELK